VFSRLFRLHFRAGLTCLEQDIPNHREALIPHFLIIHPGEFKRGAMTIEYDEKGKIFTDIVSKVAVQATIQTTTHLLRGQIHVRRDQRIKDELDLNENFLAMTNVSVLGTDGQTLFETPFLAVRRSQIIWVMPAQEKK
jgi:hypothetical protein